MWCLTLAANHLQPSNGNNFFNLNCYHRVDMKIFKLFCIILLFVPFFAYTQISAPIEKIGDKYFYRHDVKKGETLYGISKIYQVSIDQIIDNNPEINQGLREGQTIKIPAKVELDQKPKPQMENKPATNSNSGILRHRVEQGETLYSLSRRYNVSIDEILDLNPELKFGLKAGVEIRIPNKNNSTNQAIKVESTEKKERVETPEKSSTNLQTEQNKPKAEEPNDDFYFDKKEMNNSGFVKGDCENYETDRKFFNVAIILPFAAKTRDDEAGSKIAVEFLQGVRIALDSLKKSGKNIQVNVFDAEGPKNTNKLNSIINSGELDQADLIIGPLYASHFNLVSEYATRKKIPIISPFTRNEDLVRNRPFVHKAQSTQVLFFETFAQYLNSKFKGGNFIFLDPGAKADSSTNATYRNKLAKASEYNNNSFTTLKYQFSIANVQEKLRKDKHNIIIFPSEKELTINDFMTKLNKLSKDYKITLVGTENWLSFGNFDIEYFNSLNLHVPVVTFLNQSDAEVQSISQVFKERQNVAPTYYGLKGFDIAYYYIGALLKYGDHFNDCICEFEQKAVLNNIKPFRADDKSGSENISVRVIVFEDLKMKTELAK